MGSWQSITCAAALCTLLVAGCKDVVNPHVQPEGDATRLVASMAAATNQAIMSRTANQQIVLTLNNAPEANQPLEQDFINEIVELFEKRNPDIRIQYSPWQYTPESFFERLNNRTLTDIIEVDAEQMVPIIEANAAADLTENVKVTADMRNMNPDVFTITSKDGRTYGVPIELHTLALFYNRRLLDESKIVVSQAPNDKPKGQGDQRLADEDFLNLRHPLPTAPTTELAQYGRQGSYYQQPGYYQQQPQQTRGRRQQPQAQPQQPPAQSAQHEEYYRNYYESQRQYYQQHGHYFNPANYQEDARLRRMEARQKPEEDEESTRTRPTESADSSTTATEPTDDILSPDDEAALAQTTSTASDSVTTVIRTQGLPQEIEQFVRLAVRLTDHQKGVAGFAPVLYAREGGREFSQWCIQAGLKMQTVTAADHDGATEFSSHLNRMFDVTLDVDNAGEVAQFIKDLHHNYDVTPDPVDCYYDNLLTRFAQGKVGMIILPAETDTVAELMKRDMPLDDIGIMALPRGLANRQHLTYGKCLVVNSQLDRNRRNAAFKWLMFMASPEVQRMRMKFFHDEKEVTAGPSVPLYSPTVQRDFYEAIKPYRSLPLWADYEDIVASHLTLEPSFYPDRFYESLAEGIRPIVERKESDPFTAVKMIASDFDRKYIQETPPDDVLDQIVHYLTKKNRQ